MNRNMIILIILIIVLLLSLSFINKTLKKKDNILEDVKLQENAIKNDGFALMLQKEDGTYQESTSSSWPSNMKFNSELSGCIDINGNKIDGALSYNNDSKLVTLQANKTSYCYVYFDKYSLNEYLIDNVSSDGLWQSTLEEDGYRYVGTNPDNYICFGTTDKETCINDTDKYMYRIIGIFEDESGNKHLKLIKKESLNTAHRWNTDNSDLRWDSSSLYKGLNGSYFLNNTSFPYMQDSTWTDKIATWNYTMTNTHIEKSGSLNYYNVAIKNIYLHELNRNSKMSSIGTWHDLSTKISLMYASDYTLSLGEETLNYINKNDYDVLKTSWIYLYNNDSNPPGNSEWTMTKRGYDSSYYTVWRISEKGYVVSNGMNAVSNSARPVFYLESDVELSSGTGTITDPYIIKND